MARAKINGWHRDVVGRNGRIRRRPRAAAKRVAQGAVARWKEGARLGTARRKWLQGLKNHVPACWMHGAVGVSRSSGEVGWCDLPRRASSRRIM